MEIPTLEIAHTIIEGTAKSAPYIDVAVSPLLGRTELCKADLTFKARIDTGADITCIPKEIAHKLKPMRPKRRIRIREHDGGKSKVQTFLFVVELIGFMPEHASIYRPPEGVLLRDAPEGLIGMDILRYLHLEMCNGKTVLRLPS